MTRVDSTYELIEGWIGDGWLRIGGANSDPVQVLHGDKETVVYTVDGEPFLWLPCGLTTEAVALAVAAYNAGRRAERIAAEDQRWLSGPPVGNELI